MSKIALAQGYDLAFKFGMREGGAIVALTSGPTVDDVLIDGVSDAALVASATTAAVAGTDIHRVVIDTDAQPEGANITVLVSGETANSGGSRTQVIEAYVQAPSPSSGLDVDFV